MLLIFLVIPTIESQNNEFNTNDNPFKIFIRCYVEIKYYGEYSPEETYNIFGFGLRFLKDDDAEITVYSEKNGELLWQNKGIYRLRILFFAGAVDTTEDTKITFGQAFLLRALSI